MTLTLRAANESDQVAFRELFDEVARVDLGALPEPVLSPLLDLQWRAFTQSLETYPGERTDLAIEPDGSVAGRVVLATFEQNTRIIELALFASARNQGLGTRVIEQLQMSAASEAHSLRCHVKQGSPAERFYERRQFVRDGEPVPPAPSAHLASAPLVLARSARHITTSNARRRSAEPHGAQAGSAVYPIAARRSAVAL
ncbi:MAG: GNAT superfamily N-acetyltransferase [Bradymonadia bacterium]|jgi:GNAT superfamily N-acetyltransferase